MSVKVEIPVTVELLNTLGVDFMDWVKHPNPYRQVFNDWFKTDAGTEYIKENAVKKENDHA